MPKSDEALSNQKTMRVCHWILAHGDYPAIKSADPTERKMARFIVNRMRARDNKGTLTWYESDQNLANDYKLPKLFMSHFERDSNKNVHDLCAWIKKNGYNPSVRSDDPNEVILSRFLTAKKSAGRVGTAAIYESDREIAKSYGFDDLFELSQEKDSNEKVKALCAWIKLNKRIPRDGAENPIESMLGRFLEYKKDINRTEIYNSGSRPKGIIYDSDLKIAAECSMPDIFKVLSNEDRSNARTKELCEWIIKNKRTPKHNIWDDAETRISSILFRLRKNFKSGEAFDSDIAIITSYGLNDLQKLKSWKNSSIYKQWNAEKSN